MLELLNLQGTIFLLVGVGFLLMKLKIVNEEGQKCIADLVINVVLPCNIIKAFCVDFTNQMGTEIIEVLLLSALIQMIAIPYGKIAFRREEDARKKNLRCGIICSNAGFLGNPVAEGLFGSYGLLLASVFLIPVRIVMWSEGIAIYTENSDKKSAIKKTLTHPCIVSCALGLVLMVTGLRFPTMVMKSVSYLGSCNTALSMLIIGMILSRMSLKSMMDKTVWVYSLHRLIILPLIIYILTGFLPVSSMVRGCVVILTAMPAGATTSILATKYEQDPEFATKLVICSTLLSLPTLVVWSMFLV